MRPALEEDVAAEIWLYICAGVIAILLPIFYWRVLKTKNIWEIVFAPISFLIWAANIAAEHVTIVPDYMLPIILAIWTFFHPAIVKGGAK